MNAAGALPPALVDLLGILPDAVLIFDGHGVVTYVNPAVQSLLGYAPDEIVGRSLSMLVPPESRDRHDAMVAQYHREGTPKTMGERPVLRAVHKSGRLVPVSISLCNVAFEGNEATRRSVAVLHDVSLIQTHLDRVTAQAQTDALTGLGNRLRLSRQIQTNLLESRPFSLLLMDLTGFKGLNDRHGHAAGDQALQVIGRRLQSQVRDSDLASRLGGDEFVLLVDGMSDASRLSALADAAAQSLSRPMHLADGTVSVGVNIGGAIFPTHGLTEDALLAAADRAMYAAKLAGEPYRLADEPPDPA